VKRQGEVDCRSRELATPRTAINDGRAAPAAEAAVPRIVDSGATARRRCAPAIGRYTRVFAVPTIHALTIAQRLALASFIEACLRLRGSMRWRTAFYECARRGHFCPYATTEEAIHLMQLADDFGPLVVCQFRTADVWRAAHELPACCPSPP
jgi:hypothetical protein